ncbi:hypothetical protein Pcinc_038568 [Petrolisthes cinctipes]|uniref:Uncharacterized protein n=1 Tax=Petrolisthes cinctipes TaxID=88211 RepID=A0AAE1ELG7_PETCI|nr:hypothetical protein Pcinc_038568 [Petrolisthes cinctipes]
MVVGVMRGYDCSQSDGGGGGGGDTYLMVMKVVVMMVTGCNGDENESGESEGHYGGRLQRLSFIFRIAYTTKANYPSKAQAPRYIEDIRRRHKSEPKSPVVTVFALPSPKSD